MRLLPHEQLAESRRKGLALKRACFALPSIACCVAGIVGSVFLTPLLPPAGLALAAVSVLGLIGTPLLTSLTIPDIEEASVAFQPAAGHRAH